MDQRMEIQCKTHLVLIPTPIQATKRVVPDLTQIQVKAQKDRNSFKVNSLNKVIFFKYLIFRRKRTLRSEKVQIKKNQLNKATSKLSLIKEDVGKCQTLYWVNRTRIHNNSSQVIKIKRVINKRKPNQRHYTNLKSINKSITTNLKEKIVLIKIAVWQ